jgi:hypothetical protein
MNKSYKLSLVNRIKHQFNGEMATQNIITTQISCIMSPTLAPIHLPFGTPLPISSNFQLASLINVDYILEED